MQSLTGVDDFDIGIVELQGYAQSSCGIYILSGQDAESYLAIFRQVDIIFKSGVLGRVVG